MFTCFDCFWFFFTSPSGSGYCAADYEGSPADFQRPSCVCFCPCHQCDVNYPAFRSIPFQNSVSKFVEFDPFDPF